MLTSRDVGPLFACLEAQDPRVRAAALKCLIQLPLETGTWLDIGRVLNRLLDHQAVDARLLAPLAHVPLVSIRTRLRELVESEGHDLRSPIAHALAEVGDAAGATVLVGELEAQDEAARERAARAIARCGAGDSSSAAWDAARRDPQVDVSFFVALGAARSGDLAPLEEVVSRIVRENGGLDLRFLQGDPDVARAELRDIPLLPADALALVRKALEDGAPPQLAALLPDEPPSGSDDVQGGAYIPTSGDSLPPTPPGERAAAEERVAELLRFVDLEAPAKERQAEWIASRAGMVAVIRALTENLVRGPSAARVLAADFVREVSRYADLAQGPMLRGEEAPPGQEPPDLIDDVPGVEATRVLRRVRAGSDLGVARESERPRPESAEPRGSAPGRPPSPPASENPDFLDHVEASRKSGGIIATRFDDMLTRVKDVFTRTDASGDLSPEPATEIDAGKPDNADESVYALLDCEEVVPAGVEVELVVGLSPRPSEGVLGGPLTTLQDRRNYFLTVHVVADGFSLRDGESWRQTLAVTDDQRFPRVTLHLVPEPLGPGRALDARGIQATFTIAGEVAGVAFRAVTVVPDAATIQTAPRGDQARGLDLTIPRSPVPPDLTVILFRARDDHELRLTLETPHEGVPLPEEDLPVPIGDEPRAFADGIVRVMSALEGRKRMYRTLRGRGALLAVKLPDAFWDALRAVHARVNGAPTLLLVSEDPYVPWELTEVDPPLDPKAAPFLSAQTAMGRWVLRDVLLPPPHELPVGSIAAVAGDYAELPRWENLEAAFEERESLGHEWGAEPVDGTFDAMIQLLERDRPPSIVHVALHGKHSPDSVEEGLVLVDGEWLSPDVVLGTRLRGHPFVFLNACQVGAGTEVLSQYAGMAAAFLMRGASAVVAPLWNVKDEIARTVALSFYRRVLGSGEVAGEAMRAERAAFREVAGDPDAPGVSSTLMAYQFFGHPALRLRREPEVVASPDGT